VDALRVGFLAQQNLPVPPHVPGASVSRVVYELARELAASADVTVCSIEHPSVPEGMFEGVRYQRVPAGLDLRQEIVSYEVARVLRRLDLPFREPWGLRRYGRRYAEAGLRRLAEHAPDVVHLQNLSQLVPLARRLLPDARLVLHMHCDWLRELPPRVVRKRLEHVDLVLGVSDYIADRARAGFPELAAGWETLHNGVRVERFWPRLALTDAQRGEVEQLRQRLGLGEGPVVLNVGNLAPVKGNDVLLRAFELLLERIPDASLLLVGRYTRYPTLRNPAGRAARRAERLAQREYPFLVERLIDALGDRVVHVDGVPHEELGPYYALGDVFAAPSTGQEPFPLPVIESLASQLPVVATRRGGMPEIVGDGTVGRLVEPGDAPGLARALEELCGDADLRRELGARGRKLVEREYSWAQQAQRLLGLYEEIALPARAPTREAAREIAIAGG
jgi:spore coat protein SA